MLTWDTDFDTSLTYTNNDQTWEDTAGGNVNRFPILSDEINLLEAEGTAHYFEVNIDNKTSTNTFKTGWTTTSAIDGEDIVSANRDGTSTVTLDPDGTADTTWACDSDRGLSTPYKIPADQISQLGRDLQDDDRIGLLFVFGSPTSGNHLEQHVFVNGLLIASFTMNRLLNISTEAIRPWLGVQSSGAGYKMTIINEASWSFAPTADWPHLQEWGSTLVAPAADDADTGYCRMFNKGRVTDAGASTGALPLYTKGGLRAKLWAPASSTTTYNFGGTKWRATGKYYFEMFMESRGSKTATQGNIGLHGKPSAGILGGGGDTNWFQWDFGATSDDVAGPWGGSLGTSISSDSSWPDSTYFMFAVDIPDDQDNTGGGGGNAGEAKIWVGTDGTWQGSGTQNPATNEGGYRSQTSDNRPERHCWSWAPQFDVVFSSSDSDMIFQWNFGAQTFDTAIPSGFTAWDSTPLPVNLTAPSAW